MVLEPHLICAAAEAPLVPVANDASAFASANMMSPALFGPSAMHVRTRESVLTCACVMHVHCACIVCVLCMYCVCVVHALCIHFVCVMYAFFVRCACVVHALCVRCVYVVCEISF